MRTLKILLIEVAEINLSLMQRLLQRYGHSVTEAHIFVTMASGRLLHGEDYVPEFVFVNGTPCKRSLFKHFET